MGDWKEERKSESRTGPVWKTSPTEGRVELKNERTRKKYKSRLECIVTEFLRQTLVEDVRGEWDRESGKLYSGIKDPE